jgi:hypothetical protein
MTELSCGAIRWFWTVARGFLVVPTTRQRMCGLCWLHVLDFSTKNYVECKRNVVTFSSQGHMSRNYDQRAVFAGKAR